MGIREMYKFNGKGSDVRVARFSVENAPGLGVEARKDIASWLRAQAKALIRDGRNYTARKFCARYLLPPAVVKRLHRANEVKPAGRRTTSRRSN